MFQARGSMSRRGILAGGAAMAGTLAMPHVAKAQVPRLRYATGGGLGANEIVTIHLMDWMKDNVLKRHGKDYVLDVTYTRGTPEAASLLAAGQADFATLSLPAFATAIAKNAVPGGMKIVADNFQDAREGYASQVFYVLDDSSIKTIPDLKGKTIAVNAFGTAVDLLLRVALKKNGLDPRRDVRIVEISFPSIGAAIREKRVDCGVLPLPFGATERAKGGLRAVFQGKDALPPYAVIFQVATENFLKAQPAVAKAWLADYVAGLQWLYALENRKKAVELAATLSKSPPEVVDSYFLTKNDYFRDPNACLGAEQVQPPLDAMVAEGLLSARIDAKPYVDMSFLPRPCSA
ncbi:ABC transporter substrate-binding protein [Bosea sp. (in: a-proteobacteria)]|uniref:ABC transporter substrate-binding protein n=1 Tax=Bosea sp. (in: a-proteobacteria) TaxID=1871050 RepID=UPI002DDCCF02|nr:ABC transporter substrate-binding protein [Bosea sp. (in: a-proteobacteria)]HEV2508418.1 ABC transporter substrate-binding protein [Bosea sp. (in: a-proteobacteria)]